MGKRNGGEEEEVGKTTETDNKASSVTRREIFLIVLFGLLILQLHRSCNHISRFLLNAWFSSEVLLHPPLLKDCFGNGFCLGLVLGGESLNVLLQEPVQFGKHRCDFFCRKGSDLQKF